MEAHTIHTEMIRQFCDSLGCIVPLGNARAETGMVLDNSEDYKQNVHEADTNRF